MVSSLFYVAQLHKSPVPYPHHNHTHAPVSSSSLLERALEGTEGKREGMPVPVGIGIRVKGLGFFSRGKGNQIFSKETVQVQTYNLQSRFQSILPQPLFRKDTISALWKKIRSFLQNTKRLFRDWDRE
jgi:hypothetical protein